MFCLMDVSGSMTEHMKDLAKRFYTLLYIFLKRRYRHVEIVFIRHTHEAQEVDEETFFHSRRDRRHGGLHRAGGDGRGRRRSAIRRRTGTSTPPRPPTATTRRATTQRTAALLDETHPAGLPVLRLSGGGPEDEPSRSGFAARPSDLWRTYEQLISEPARRFAMRKVRHRRDIFPVFRELFRRRERCEEPRRMSVAARSGPAALSRARIGTSPPSGASTTRSRRSRSRSSGSTSIPTRSR